MSPIYCKFKLNQQKGICICSECGYETESCNSIKECTGKQQLPSLSRRILNFIAAASQHAIAGNPIVTDKVLKERLEICQGCPLFKRNENQVGGVCTHSNCGCNIKDNLNYLNKIAWADQECPIGKWGKSENGV